ncbi:polysaccharide deacetylase family protein [Novosphingobium mangrovi (ex Huang et al. 2023)]|uniref:Polysaccharide deacetylase family protein n=1 Tax=Novosphingobium mangrovi (ex Huang et al. 2023) TaxID=2976432 RepID=A0ABT2I6G9_9SPHN|nr:polysaccharide deacetylase family protein [Novosphingobium mangrovi (ex Huang et al. 2023)]MCT2400413.1 polysaccharide deacetylase family protein [Novosphingobium mangrovi (ex Huang et al. 2023)]
MSGPSLLEPPGKEARAAFREGFGQRFIVTVDTEEEFDWDAPLDREKHSLVTVPALRQFQQFCEDFGVIPTYLIDYPVACSPEAPAAIGDAVANGRADVGVQLHPWVSPPFEEEVTEFNSYAGNLPFELERAKFHTLRDRIEQAFGTAPRIYRAGRYGLGPRTGEILRECGIAIDTSVRARFDYSGAGGPNYRDHPLHPYWADAGRSLLELPLTTVYWGPLRQMGNVIYPHLWRAPSMRGVLARAGLLERIALTPEGITAEEALRGVDIAIDEGLPVLVFSFHSPSLAPGHTPYVRGEADLEALYAWWRTLFAHLERRGVKPTSVSDILSSVELASSHEPS